MKSELAAELSSLLAFSSIKNNDKVGLLLFSDEIESYIPPRKTTTHVLRIIRDVLYYSSDDTGTDIARAIEYLHRVLRRKAVIFLLSDFFADDFEKPLSILARKHDLIAVNVADPREEKIPGLGFIKFYDRETREFIELDTRNKAFRDGYADVFGEHKNKIKKIFDKSGVDSINLLTAESYVMPLIKFFYKRRQKKWR